MRRALLLLLTVWTLLPGACRPAPPAPAAAEAGDVRLVVLSPALGVIVRDVGMAHRVVGRHAWDAALDPAVPAVGAHDDPDLEAIIRLRPTHVLLQETQADAPRALLDAARRHGWTVWSFPLLALDDVPAAADELHERLDAPGPPPGPGLRAAWSDLGEPARRAGRVLLLAGVDPPSAMGPGSFHHDLIERMGCTPAITDGGPWQELDHEDVLRLAPDAVLLFRPAVQGGVDPSISDATGALGGIGDLDIPAVRTGRLGVITHPLGLLPASSLAGVAAEIESVLASWPETP